MRGQLWAGPSHLGTHREDKAGPSRRLPHKSERFMGLDKSPFRDDMDMLRIVQMQQGRPVWDGLVVERTMLSRTALLERLD